MSPLVVSVVGGSWSVVWERRALKAEKVVSSFRLRR